MKRKRLLWLLSPLLILTLLIGGIPASADDLPGLPHPFYGTLTIGGSDALVGTVVTAKVGGVEVGSITTTVEGKYGPPGDDRHLSVGADIAIEEGATINFYADDAVTDQTYAFDSGADPTELNLTVTVADTTSPTVGITITDPVNAANVGAVAVTITSDEDGTYTYTISDGTNELTGTDTISAGVAVDLSLDLSTLDDGPITADASVEDAAENVGAATQDTATKDTVLPTVGITITDPVNAANVGAVPVTITSNEGGTYSYTISDGTVAHDVTGSGSITAGVDVDLTPDLSGLDEGSVTADASVEDAAGNTGVATQDTATKDTVSPTVAIDAVTTPTDVATQTLTGTMEEGATVVLTADTAASCGAASYDTTTWSCDVSGLVEGSNVITATATDAAGNTGTATDTIVFDTVVPTVTITSTATSPTSTSPIPMTATFTEDVTGFEASDITPGNGTVSNFVANGAVYTFDVTPTADGAVTVDIAADAAADAAGYGNTVATQFSITYDSIHPTVTITSTATSPTSTPPGSWLGQRW